jgi:hypothetical protein
MSCGPREAKQSVASRIKQVLELGRVRMGIADRRRLYERH